MGGGLQIPYQNTLQCVKSLLFAESVRDCRKPFDVYKFINFTLNVVELKPCFSKTVILRSAMECCGRLKSTTWPLL